MAAKEADRDSAAQGRGPQADADEMYEWRVASEFRQGHAVREFVHGFAARCGMEPEAISDLLLAVTEVFNNAVEHGHRFDAQREVLVQVCRLDNAVRVDITDQGTGFTANTELQPARVQPTQRGLGLFLVRTLVDKVSFSHGSGTTVHLFKKLPA